MEEYGNRHKGRKFHFLFENAIRSGDNSKFAVQRKNR